MKTLGLFIEYLSINYIQINDRHHGWYFFMKSDSLEYLKGVSTGVLSNLSLAPRSVLDGLVNASEGLLLVDRSGYVDWMNGHDRRDLCRLGADVSRVWCLEVV